MMEFCSGFQEMEKIAMELEEKRKEEEEKEKQRKQVKILTSSFWLRLILFCPEQKLIE